MSKNIFRLSLDSENVFSSEADSDVRRRQTSTQELSAGRSSLCTEVKESQLLAQSVRARCPASPVQRPGNFRTYRSTNLARFSQLSQFATSGASSQKSMFQSLSLGAGLPQHEILGSWSCFTELEVSEVSALRTK